MRLSAFALFVCLLGLPAWANAQGYGSGTTSVIRPAGYGWRNHVTVPDGPCGCAMPVKTDCYNECCPSHCGWRPFCLLSKIHRVLDCLLPCNRCCGAGAHGCGFGHRWGGAGVCCGVGCSTGGSCCSPAMPALEDPFQDDAAPPKPQPASEVRRVPSRIPTARTPSRPTTTTAQRQSPWKVTTGGSQGVAPASGLRPVGDRSGQLIPPGTSKPADQSVLRRTSYDEVETRPAPAPKATRPAQPVIRSQSPDVSDIPHNPLRG